MSTAMGDLGKGSRSFDQVVASARHADTSLAGMLSAGRVGDWVRRNSAAIDELSGDLLRVGVVGAAAFAAPAKLAADWEYQFAGVRKTVSGTAGELRALKGDLENLAVSGSVASSFKEIASVAEQAGQLGVAREHIVDFSRTVIQLQDSTNLGADAAKNIAQSMAVMGESFDNVDRYGATLVDLGNNFATTEADIQNFMFRLGPMASTMGMSTADTLAFGTALSSVGIMAEAGGSSMGTMLMKMNSAVREGNSSLTALAETAGLSRQAFQDLWREDSALAVNSVVEGLGKIKAEGGDVAGKLKEMGVTNIRERTTMLALAGASEAAGNEVGRLGGAIERARGAWESNSALVNEASQRYETFQARAQMMQNAVSLLGIQLGEAVLPSLTQLVMGVSDATKGMADFAEANPGIVTLGGSFILAASGMGVLLGSIGKGITAFGRLKDTIASLQLSSGALRGIGLALGAGLAVATLALAAFAAEQQKSAERAQEWGQALRSSGEEATQAVTEIGKKLLESETGGAFGHFGITMKKALEDVGLSAESLHAALAEGPDAIDAYADSLENLAYKKGLVGENGSSAQQTFADELRKQADAYRQQADAIATMKAAEKDALLDSAAAQSENARTGEQMRQTLQANSDAYKDLIAQIRAYADQLTASHDKEIAMYEAQDALSKRLSDIKKGAEGAAVGLDLSTKSGRENQKAIDALMTAINNNKQSLLEQGAGFEEIHRKIDGSITKWRDMAVAMGLPREEADALARQMLELPTDVVTRFREEGGKSVAQRVAEIHERIKKLPKSTQTKVKALVDKGDLAAAEALIDRVVRTRTANVVVRAKEIVVGGGPAARRATQEADGGVLEFYARGGLRERHVAQIAPAGSWRIWAEPETGGEAYIPLAASKRQRSLAIWRETGRRLGVNMGRAFADGGFFKPTQYVNSGSNTTMTVNQSFGGESPGVAAQLAANAIQWTLRANRL